MATPRPLYRPMPTPFLQRIGQQHERYLHLVASDNFSPQGGPTLLLSTVLGGEGLAWSGDGKDIIYSSGQQGRAILQRIAPGKSASPRPVAILGDGINSRPLRGLQGQAKPRVLRGRTRFRTPIFIGLTWLRPAIREVSPNRLSLPAFAMSSRSIRPTESASSSTPIAGEPLKSGSAMPLDRDAGH